MSNNNSEPKPPVNHRNLMGSFFTKMESMSFEEVKEVFLKVVSSFNDDRLS